MLIGKDGAAHLAETLHGSIRLSGASLQIPVAVIVHQAVALGPKGALRRGRLIVIHGRYALHHRALRPRLLHRRTAGLRHMLAHVRHLIVLHTRHLGHHLGHVGLPSR